MRRKSHIITGLAATALIFTGAAAANAGGSLQGYNTTVGKFNGSGYTGFQKKSIPGATGELESSRVGGNYVVDVRMIHKGSNDGAWTRNVTDYTLYYLYNDIPGGNSTRLQFSNDITTPVNVQVVGAWASE
ncbi:hypothetical protein [Arthrobacter castelli]|uniref:hypothetical protein n=1 Tax=Arthrobacter castelli TaxID=271431 RepID=UPI000407B88A|nr:hypothetical protein [Arthrobacter castelli]